MKRKIMLFYGLLILALAQAQTPHISVFPSSLSEDLYTGESAVQSLLISNEGSGSLSCYTTVVPTSGTGGTNRAIQLDGSNDYCIVYNDPSLQITSEITIEAWIKFQAGGSGKPVILSKGRPVPDYEVFLDTTLQTSKIGMILRPMGTLVSQTTLAAGTWYHIACSYDGSAMKMYINGELDASLAVSGSLTTSNYGLYFGRRDNTSNRQYKGALDDIRLWHTARTQEEIRLNMNHEITGTDTSLSGYWQFNESTGSRAYDMTSFQNDASLINGVVRLDSDAPIINWLFTDPVVMEIGPGSSSTMDALFNAAGMNGGTYGAQIIFHSNDPDIPHLPVPVDLEVTSVAHILLSTNLLDFGEVFTGESDTLFFVISNSGNGTLEVISMTCPNPDYRLLPETLSIAPGASDSVGVIYSPSAAGNDDADLTILSNDYLFPSVNLALKGDGIPPPVITVYPSSLSAELYSGKTSWQTLTISNAGLSNLEWEITLQNAGYPTVTFTKNNYTNWNDPANQDRITSNVYITRANSQGIFNAKTESAYNHYVSPDDTEWAYGYTKDLEPGDYRVWRDAVSGSPPGMVNNPISMHLISDDLYFDVLFHSWTSQGNGGGFSYTRTSVNPAWLQVDRLSGTLAAGASVDIEVTFDAALLEGGEYDGIIAITSNDPVHPLIEVPAHLEVTDAPCIFSEQDTLDFGILYVGFDESKTMMLEVKNIGSLDLLISEVTTSDEAFTADPALAGIDPGESETFAVTFTPAETGDYSGWLTLSSNDPVQEDFYIALLGQFMPPPEISVTPGSLEAILYSGKSATQTLTISNSGGSDLHFSIAPEEDAVSGGNRFDGWLSCEPSQGVCPVGGSVIVIITFDAAYLPGGQYSADLIVSSNDPAYPETVIPATLEVTDAPSFHSEQDTLDFDVVYLGYTETLQILVENNGSQDLLIFSVEAVPDEFSVTPPFASLDPGESETFSVTFEPGSVGAFMGHALFSSNDPVFEDYMIMLRGVCLEPPVITVAPDSIVVEVQSGQTATEPVTIYNTGKSDLHFSVSPGGVSFNYALQFDGMDDFVNCVNSPSLHLQNSVTFEAWIYPFSWNGNNRILSKYQEYEFFAENGVFKLLINGLGVLTCALPSTNTWHHVAGVYDDWEHVMKIYYDGEKVAEQITGTPYFYPYSYDLCIGTKYIYSPYYDFFNGIIDEVRIWHDALTQEEIQYGMHMSLTGSEPGLAGSWNFNEGYGMDANDQSPNANNGTLVNGVAWTESSSPLYPSWLTVSPDAGIIPAEQNLVLTASMDAGELYTGDYFATIFIASNDPVMPMVSLPVHLIVTPYVGLEEGTAISLQPSVVIYPNPFGGYTTFEYELPETGRVSLVIYDRLGKKTGVPVDEIQPMGKHRVTWYADDLEPGIYFYRLISCNQAYTGKIVKLRIH